MTNSARHHSVANGGDGGGGGSLEGTLVKRGSVRTHPLDPAINHNNEGGDKNSSIPLIEFHLVNGEGPPSGSNGSKPGPRPKTAMGRRINNAAGHDEIQEESEENSDMVYRAGGSRTKHHHVPDQNNSNKAYIKYNSFANY